MHNLIGSSSVHVSVFAGPTSDFLKAPVPQPELISALDPVTLQAAQEPLGFHLQPQVRGLDLERQVQHVQF